MAGNTAAIFGILAVICLTSVAADIRCYSCTSYMSQCKQTVDDTQGDVFKTNCNSKCFVRRGEDGAIYRGCFDGFMEVNDLKYSYAGCKNQTWNRQSLEWCMCDTDLCNSDMMQMRQPSTAKQPASNNFHKYDYNDIAYDIKEQKFNAYDDLKYDSKYDYDITYDAKNKKYVPSNKASSYMDRYAREGPIDAEYDESLFGIKEQNYQDTYKEIKYMSDETPSYPPQYQLKYFGPGSQTVDRYDSYKPDSRVVNGYDGSPEDTYQITNDYRQQLYYPHQPQYARETGPAYNYNTPPQPYNDPHQEDSTNYVSARLATKIRCNKSGYYQNPNDCRQFVACLLDPYSKTPIMHVMKCPDGLVWDNKKKICMEYSTTCNVVVSNLVEDGLREKQDKLDITGFESNTINDRVHGQGDSESAHGGEDGDSLDNWQDNTYDVSGDVKHDVYSDVYGVDTNEDFTDVVF